ncbi:ArsR/SmtB family transcription factor [Nocardioides marmoribigeumensis]|uniref:DNA-binding transcriptional ArsR family regulator n=1 Tax=Nocardioides marmoribigeumensis TaxID=433649 RepID=A0ABU2C0D7_9ACTN|nr:helix-turn-helix domain-containing protein [Nocardioides marmoribigeumensis]MDR7364127.1 DNA-binding transcriptional ArsR family regulator [Nocardioides marmoribigeumensis]
MPESAAHLRALAHPLRLRMLSLLTGTDLTAAEVARELGVTHANASYHLRFLLDAGELEVVGEERIRGGLAKRYRHPWRLEDRAPQPEGGPEERGEAGELFVQAAADELRRRYAQRATGTGGLVADAEVWVTPEVYAEARDLLRRAAELLHDEAGPPRAEGTQPVSLSVFSFVMQDRRP